MIQKRTDQRINYVSKCLLNVQGTSYSGLLENISTTGASIKLIDDVPETVQCGNVCVLSALLLTPVKCPSKILRIDSTQIALQFINR
jgi:c-di-GMP-binding flagellar brake protein YcgR